MKTITREELDVILEKHKKWLHDETGGKRADLSGTDLCQVDLSYTNLSRAILLDAYLLGANFYKANLTKAHLSRSDLRNANFVRANLSRADMYGADLSGANLSRANLFKAVLPSTKLTNTNLFRATLTRAYLAGADFYKADLTGANLTKAILTRAYLGKANLTGANIDWPMACPDTGSFIGFKRCANDTIVTLEILKDSIRSSATTNQCRCDKAKVIDITSVDGEKSYLMTRSIHDPNFIYTVGEFVKVENFDTNRWNECSRGIHFFMERDDAIYFHY